MIPRIAHPWTIDKLRFLEKFLPAFVRATKKALNRFYVDGFAGLGINEVEGRTYLGSPLIALPLEFDRLFFVEKDRENFESLRKHIEERDPVSLKKGRVELYNADFNTVLDKILDKIPNQAPTMFFLDPEGLELHWTTVEKIAERKKVDLFILISASGVLRNALKRGSWETLTRFFGDESWKGIRPKPGHTWFEAYAEHYRNRMRELGLEGSEYVIVARNRKNTPMHILAFHSKHKVGLKIANDVIRSFSKQTRLLP